MQARIERANHPCREGDAFAKHSWPNCHACPPCLLSRMYRRGRGEMPQDRGAYVPLALICAPPGVVVAATPNLLVSITVPSASLPDSLVPSLDREDLQCARICAHLGQQYEIHKGERRCKGIANSEFRRATRCNPRC